MRFNFLILVILSGQLVNAQDLSGIWRGSFVSSDRLQSLGMPSDRYKLEVQIDQHDKIFNSVTYSYKTTLFYGKAVANGTVNPKTGKVWLEETKIVELKMQFGAACIMTYKLQYSKNDNEEFLEGTWVGYGEKDSSLCGRGTVLLHKVMISDFYKEPFLSKKEPEKKLAAPLKKNPDTLAKKALATAPKKPGVTKKTGNAIAKNTPVKPVTIPPSRSVSTNKKTPNSTPKKNGTVEKTPASDVTAKAHPPVLKYNAPRIVATAPSSTETDTIKKTVPQIKKSVPVIVPRILATRENELVKTIIVNSNEISINIYDNGTIDHDTVSVYLDKKLVISKQMLTTSPINLKFSMDENDAVHELVMVAENEGDIPPNTSLMVVRAGDKIYEVRITSTEQKNAVVIFKYEKAK
jgi:hypothetical protein